MYLFKNTEDKWIFGNTIHSECPAGTYRVDPSTDFRTVTIRSLANDAIMFRDVAIGDFLKADGTAYASFAALKLGYDGFFQASAGGSGTSTTVEQSDASKLKVTEASAAAALTALQAMDDWDESDRAKVNLIASQAGIDGGAGAVTAKTPRFTHASDDPAVARLKEVAGQDFLCITDSSAHTGLDCTMIAVMNDAVFADITVAASNVVAGKGLTGITVVAGTMLPFGKAHATAITLISGKVIAYIN